MKKHMIMLAAITMAALWALAMMPMEAMAGSETGLLKDYQVAEARPFEVPQNMGAPSSEGRAIADELVIQIGRYNAKYNLFEMVILEGAQKVPAGKKVLLVKGKVTEYSPNGILAVHCLLVDKASGKVLLETDARSFRARVANYIAKIIYQNKVEK